MDIEVSVRMATVDDIEDLIKLRLEMFKSSSMIDKPESIAEDKFIEIINRTREPIKQYFLENIPNKEFFGWLAFNQHGEAIGSGGAIIHKNPPSPSNISGKIGYIMNISTMPNYRRMGVATKITTTILKWLKEQGITKVTLHPSRDGRFLYRKLGFAVIDEMILDLSLNNISL
ncbi:MAG: GNAT family N-acetyltransferase [Candidatus Heimdallarchaeota archaeon]|nr:GNAT family N-acetyltransferase [Candidatus Heimdallarchaeota archaeon]